jgi:hypothetical protein
MSAANGPVPSWTCPTCSTSVATPYCPTCGESPVRSRDLALRGVAYQLFNALSSIDGRLIRSLRRLLTRPGSLTVAYVNGPRKPYIGPFPLFLVANVVFVAVQSMTGTNVFSSTLDNHLHIQDWSPVAQRLVLHHLETARMTLDQYAPIFNRAVVFHAKALVVSMIVPFSLLLPIVFYRARKTFGVHVVFAVHTYAFLLLLFCVSLVIDAVDVLCGGGGFESAAMDTILSTLNLAACTAYLYVASGPVYGVRGVTRALASLTLALAVGAIVLGYRFGLFLFTLYVT